MNKLNFIIVDIVETRVYLSTAFASVFIKIPETTYSMFVEKTNSIIFITMWKLPRSNISSMKMSVKKKAILIYKNNYKV